MINVYELQFKAILDDLNVDYVQEYAFAKERFKRRFRFDFAIPSRKIAFEIDGGIFGKFGRPGRHLRPIGYCRDCVKQFIAEADGWHVYRIPAPWLSHHKRKKAQNHLMYYEDMVAMIKTILSPPIA